MITEYEHAWSMAYPNAVKLADADPEYNCHSYAVYGLGSVIKYWINDPSAFYTDGSFNEVLGSSPYYPQYSLIYNPSLSGSPYYVHSMVRISANTYVSKWGAFGRYRHSLTDNPYYIELDDLDLPIGPLPVKHYLLNPDYSDY